ncbi:MAG: NUDIX domain-containing protein [Bacteroidales bacterium]|nr:NUDIX domain-containing protein [Bacteroidales bacterium]
MFDLVYPVETAPLLGMREVPKGAEILPVVEPTGQVIGRTTREFCHAGSNPLHPVVHLHVIDRFSRVYLQKRGPSKDLYPGLWDTAVGGHVGYGEFLEEALYREAAEELALYDFNPVYLRSYVFHGRDEEELMNVFATIRSSMPKVSNDEVSEARFWTPGAITRAKGKGILTPNFEAEYEQIKDALEALL